MADESFERVLRLVSEGHLTAEEAGPILDALANRPPAPPAPASPPPAAPPPSPDEAPGRALRIQVFEHGRAVVNLRVPIALGRAAIGRVPGISEQTSERIREAIAAGIKGPIIEVDDADADNGVKISIE
jgi:hypothetical protein